MDLPPAPPPEGAWLPLVEMSVAEDLGPGDVTTPLCVEPGRAGRARIEAREPLVVCGLFVAERVFRRVDPEVAFRARAREGEELGSGRALAEVAGPLRSLLAAERTALNFLQRTCGVATWTRRFARAVEGTGARVCDTRKTLPGWRALDKYAAAAGGATTHRMGLYDGILLKDNHVAAAGGVVPAVKAARGAAPPHLRVQVEVESLAEARAAVEAGADFLLLDNCDVPTLRAIAAELAGEALLEASGGVDLANVREIAETGVHRVSVGALTHSAPAVDLAMEIAADGGVPA